MKFETFSQREAKKNGIFPPPPQLKSLPGHLRQQIATIFAEAFGIYDARGSAYGELPATNETWELMDRLMHRESAEYCQFANQYKSYSPRSLFLNFIMQAADASALDAVDLGVRIISKALPEFQDGHRPMLDDWEVKLEAEEAVDEIDTRLRESGTVYRIVDGFLIVSTDDFTHKEIVVPALQALGEPGFENALSEFHEALHAFKDGIFDTVLTKANHAFESTMKIIAGKMGWPYDEKLTAAPMLDVLIANGLLPPMRDGAMKAMIAMMKSDVPTLRNRMPSAGHGAGEKTNDIPEPFATYALNASASNIRFLMESYRLNKPAQA